MLFTEAAASTVEVRASGALPSGCENFEHATVLSTTASAKLGGNDRTRHGNMVDHLTRHLGGRAWIALSDVWSKCLDPLRAGRRDEDDR